MIINKLSRVVVSPRREVQFAQLPAQFAVVVDPEVQVVQGSLRRLDVWEVEHGQLRLPVGTDFEFFYHWHFFMAHRNHGNHR